MRDAIVEAEPLDRGVRQRRAATPREGRGKQVERRRTRPAYRNAADLTDEDDLPAKKGGVPVAVLVAVAAGSFLFAILVAGVAALLLLRSRPNPVVPNSELAQTVDQPRPAHQEAAPDRPAARQERLLPAEDPQAAPPAETAPKGRIPAPSAVMPRRRAPAPSRLPRSTPGVSPAALRPGEVLPKKAVTGKPFTYQLPGNEEVTFQLLRGPEGMTVSADGKLDWTPGPGPARTEMVTVRVNPSGVLFFKIAVEEDPGSALALPEPGGWVMLSDGATLIVSLPEEAKLAYIDTVANREIKRVDLPFSPAALAYQGKRLFAAARGAARLYVLDLQSGAVKEQIKVPEGALADLTCHRQKGLVYATTHSKRIVAIDPVAATATATRARGMFLAIDPMTGDALYAAIQPEMQDVLVIRELSRGRFLLSSGIRGDRALLAKLSIHERRLEVVGVNPNAATNGYLVRLSADGSRVAVVGGGGYRLPLGDGRGEFEPYGVGLFETGDINELSGVVAVGAYPHDLAFHPVLDLGVAEQVGVNTALHLFHSKSLAKIRAIPISGGPPGQTPLPRANAGRLLTFGARGTKLLYYDHAGQGTLRSIALDLSEQDQEALERAYGKGNPRPAAPPAPDRGPEDSPRPEKKASKKAAREGDPLSVAPPAPGERTVAQWIEDLQPHTGFYDGPRAQRAEAALARIGRPAVPKLLEVLRTATNEVARNFAAGALADMGDQAADAQSELTQMARDDRNATVRHWAAIALRNIRGAKG